VVTRPGVATRRSPGGAPLFAAQALAHAGARAAVATRCSDARLAAPIVAAAERVCLRLDDTQVSSLLRYREDGEREHELAGLSPPWSVDDVEGFAASALAGADWVQAGTQHAGDLGPDVLAALARGGRPLALDGQGPLRRRRLGPLALEGTLDAALLAHVRALKLSEEEAGAAFGTLDAVEIARRSGVPEVLVTFGRSGACVAAGGDTANVATRAVPDVDPTGAGDAFLALYALARAEGRPPLASTEHACNGVARWLSSRG
jgi:sugar/nucleoside kinase (ribokinase family)